MRPTQNTWSPRVLPRLMACLIIAVGTMGGALSAWAWGDLGHKIVCACTWPDHSRKRAEEHFINVPRTLQTIATAQCQGAPTCLFTPIVTDREVLQTFNDDQDRLASLKFLGHWVGDIHQPLHVSFADDRGATSSARAVRA